MVWNIGPIPFVEWKSPSPTSDMVYLSNKLEEISEVEIDSYIIVGLSAWVMDASSCEFQLQPDGDVFRSIFHIAQTLHAHRLLELY